MSGQTVEVSDVPAVVRRLRFDAPVLARAVIDRYVDESGLYTPETIPGHLYRDSLHTMRTFIDTALRAVLDDGLDVHALMRDVLARGNDRVAEGVPLRNYLHCWQLAMEVLVETLDDRLGENPAVAGPVLARVREVYDGVIREAVSAYELTSREVMAAQIGRSARLIAHLLDGVDYPLADDPGTIPEHPVVVLIDIGATPAELTGSEETRTIAMIRKARLIRGAVQRGVAGMWLADARARSVRLITSSPPADLHTVVDALRAEHGVPVTAAFAEADGVDDLRRASSLAADVLRIAMSSGRTGTVSSVADVALDYHLTHDSVALEVLLRNCAALAPRRDLVDTLRAYFDNDLDRRRTADALHVHPNTIDNRLGRIRELTDLDVRRFPDLLALAVATNPVLAARRS